MGSRARNRSPSNGGPLALSGLRLLFRCSLSSDPLRLQALPVCMECLLVAFMLGDRCAPRACRETPSGPPVAPRSASSGLMCDCSLLPPSGANGPCAMLRIRTANLGGRFSPGGAFGGPGAWIRLFAKPFVPIPWCLEDDADFRCALAGFFAAASFAGSLPSIDVSISFWPAAALRGFLAGWQPSPARPSCRLGVAPPSGRRRWSRGLRLRRDRFPGALLVDEVDQRGLVVVLELLRLEAAKSERSNCYLRRMSLAPF